MSLTTSPRANPALGVRSFAILTDVTLCIGCEECVAACKRANGTGEDDAPCPCEGMQCISRVCQVPDGCAEDDECDGLTCIYGACVDLPPVQ